MSPPASNAALKVDAEDDFDTLFQDYKGQIEAKTMSKLRQPSRSQVLRDYLD